MTYNVFGGTLNPTLLLLLVYICVWLKAAVVWRSHLLLHLMLVSSKPSKHTLVICLTRINISNGCIVLPFCQLLFLYLTVIGQKCVKKLELDTPHCLKMINFIHLLYKL